MMQKTKKHDMEAMKNKQELLNPSHCPKQLLLPNMSNSHPIKPFVLLFKLTNTTSIVFVRSLRFFTLNLKLIATKELSNVFKLSLNFLRLNLKMTKAK